MLINKEQFSTKGNLKHVTYFIDGKLTKGL